MRHRNKPHSRCRCQVEMCCRHIHSANLWSLHFLGRLNKRKAQLVLVRAVSSPAPALAKRYGAGRSACCQCYRQLAGSSVKLEQQPDEKVSKASAARAQRHARRAPQRIVARHVRQQLAMLRACRLRKHGAGAFVSYFCFSEARRLKMLFKILHASPGAGSGNLAVVRGYSGNSITRVKGTVYANSTVRQGEFCSRLKR